MRSLRREPALFLALLAVASLALAFIVYPQIQVILTPGPDGYVSFLQEGTWLSPLRNSIQLTALSTTTAVLLGFVYAYAMVYSNMRWKPFFRLIGILPLLSPPFVVAAAYTLLFGARGIVSYGVFGQSPNIYGLGGVWGVQTIAFFPFAYQLIADALSRSDPRMEQAARNLGAGSWRVFWTVTLPLSRPGLGAAILTTAIYILEDFGNPQLIGGQFYVLPTQAYNLISGFGEYTSAAAVSTILLLLALGLYLGKVRLDGGRSFVTISGRASSMPRPPVSPGLSWACFAACLALAGLILLVYGSLVVSALTLRFPNNLQFTLEHFQYVTTGTNGEALRNTLVFSSVAAGFSAIFALFAAWLVQRGQWPGKRALDLLLILPAAIPGIFFGLGYVTAFNQRWLDFVYRGWLIIIAFIFWNIPVGYQAAVAGLRQIDRSIDEAATSLGASSMRGFREVLLPMLGGSLRVGLVTTFVRAVTTLSLVIFLFTPPTTVATIRIYQLVNDLNWGAATAFTVADIGMAILALSIFAVLARGRIALGAARA
ncbi:MAG: iron ABC transporter permease [Chloroflexi bacterium]|nr:MAG: iron ABC transporter permease [Chloroflexota bacterium]TMG51203.1 MAG: iron ABC transporter permease [Chloroflexota bacterium]